MSTLRNISTIVVKMIFLMLFNIKKDTLSSYYQHVDTRFNSYLIYFLTIWFVLHISLFKMTIDFGNSCWIETKDICF